MSAALIGGKFSNDKVQGTFLNVPYALALALLFPTKPSEPTDWLCITGVSVLLLSMTVTPVYVCV